MASITTIVVLMLCFVITTVTAAHYHHHRLLLHQPFFPLTATPPPIQPPALAPQPNSPPTPPKYPFSTAPPNTLQKPFFPILPSPPPPPSSSASPLVTFPANISSILFPHPPSSSSGHRHLIITLSVSVSLFLLAILVAISAFVVYTRRHHNDHEKASRTDSLRLFPPNTVPSDGSPKPPKLPHRPGVPNTSSEFLYLGTLVNSRAGIDDVDHQQKLATLSNVGVKIGPLSSSTSPPSYQKLGSPELRPLPPLPRSNTYTPTYRSGEVLIASDQRKDGRKLVGRDDDLEAEEEEEFFSPRGSSGRRESGISPAVAMRVGSSSSRRDFQVENFGSRSFNSRTASYPYSNSVSPVDSMSSSPSQASNSSRRSLKSDNNNSPRVAISFPNVGQSNGERSLPSRSVSSSSSLSGNTRNSAEQNSGSGSKESLIGNVSGNGFFMPARLPPPPPPPPPRFWETPERVRVGPEVIVGSTGPPVLVAPSRPVLGQNVMPSLGNEQFQSNGGSVERSEETTPKPKLKPLHWDKVRASSDRVMVWDQIKSSSFQLNEEMIETLFMVNNSNLNANENNGRRQSLPFPNPENRVLDPKKSQNIAILLRALNVTIDEVCEALLEGNSDTLGTELLESLLKMAPTKEEERKLKEFKDESPFKLGPAEKFLKAVLDIPFAFKRVDAILYITNFDSEVEYLERSFKTLEVACGELKNSGMFLKLLEAVLKTGNRMNVGTNRGDARAFKLDTLLKLVDVKGTDGKTTLLHFVVQEIIRSAGSRLSGTDQNQTAEKNHHSTLHDDVEFRKLGLQVVAGLSGELSNVKKAAAMDSDVLSSEVSKLASGITKIREVLKLNEEVPLKESSRKFSESMNAFLKKAEEEIVRIQAQEKVALSLLKEITEYFHGNSAKEEAHPFRIFMVVRDFLSILDQVCKEVGKINERTIYSSVRPMPTISTLPPVFPGLNGRQNGFSDDEIPSP